MRVSCERARLIEKVSFCLGAVASKSTIAALEGILIKTGEGNITLTGYDLELGIRTTLEAEVGEAGGIVLGGRMFLDILRSLPDEIVNIDVNEKNAASITSGKSVFTIIGIPAEDFPELQRIEAEKSFSLPQGLLKDMVSSTLFSVSTNENKPIQTGCLFDIADGFLNVVAVDGFRLALRREAFGSIGDIGELNFVVPGAALKQVERILEDNDEQAELVLSRKHMGFSIGDTYLVTRLLEGEFINYKNVIPKETPIEIKVGVKTLLSSVERVALIVNERLKNPVRLIMGYDVIRMSCATASGQSYDECPAVGNGNDLEIGFNSRYVAEALKAVGDEEIVLKMTNALSPCLIYPTEGDSFLYLVLPVRLRAGDV